MTTIGVLYDEWTKERFRRHYKMAKVNDANRDCAEAIRAAGIKVKE